jgi:putative aldouronate transport system permease protein
MKDTFIRRLNRNKVFLIMLIPAVVYILIFAYTPMVGIILAFKKYTYAGGIFGSPWSGFRNFEFFFRSGRAFLVTRNTVLYNLLFIAFNTVLQISVAVLLTELRGKLFRRISQSLMFLPYFISWVVVSVMAFNILSYDFGFINGVLSRIGLEKLNFYNNGAYWPAILTFFGAWKGVGYGSVLYLAAIMGIDTEIYEAAAIDGAGVFRRIFSITIPLMMPTVMILFLLAIGGIFKGNFDMFYNLVGNNGVLHSWTDVIDTFTFRALITNNDFGMSSAVGLYQSVLCFATILLANKLVKVYNEDYSLF